MAKSPEMRVCGFIKVSLWVWNMKKLENPRSQLVSFLSDNLPSPT